MSSKKEPVNTDMFVTRPPWESPVAFRTRYTHVSRLVDPGLTCPDTPEDRRTKSEFVDECDINKIMARYRRTGILPENARAAAVRYGDFSQIPDFMEMQEKIIAANELFMALPAEVRKQFDNDPGQFIAAADTQEGREVMVKLGLGAERVSSPQEPPKGSAPASAGQAETGGTEPPVAGDKPASPTKSVK